MLNVDLTLLCKQERNWELRRLPLVKELKFQVEWAFSVAFTGCRRGIQIATSPQTQHKTSLFQEIIVKVGVQL